MRELCWKPTASVRGHVGHAGRRRHARPAAQGGGRGGQPRCSGRRCQPEHVIGETLRRATPLKHLDDPAFVAKPDNACERSASQHRPPSYAAFINDPLSIWIEIDLGHPAGAGTRAVDPRQAAQDRAARRRRRKLSRADRHVRAHAASRPSRTALLAGYAVAATRKPAFPSSRSGCTSSSARATRFTPRWKPRPSGTSRPRASSSCRTRPRARPAAAGVLPRMRPGVLHACGGQRPQYRPAQFIPAN